MGWQVAGPGPRLKEALEKGTRLVCITKKFRKRFLPRLVIFELIGPVENVSLITFVLFVKTSAR